MVRYERIKAPPHYIKDPSLLKFKQCEMRNYYNKCIKDKHFCEFPSEEGPELRTYNKKRSMLNPKYD